MFSESLSWKGTSAFRKGHQLLKSVQQFISKVQDSRLTAPGGAA